MFLAAQHVRTLKRKTPATQALNATLFHGEEDLERIKHKLIEVSREALVTRDRQFGKALASQQRELDKANSLLSRSVRRAKLANIRRKYRTLNAHVARFDKLQQLFAQGKGTKEYLELIKRSLAAPHTILQSEVEDEIPNLKHLLLNLSWGICECPTNRIFLTSDSPVVILPKFYPASNSDYEAHFHYNAARLGIVGFASLEYLFSNYPPLEFHIPLSPRYALCASDDIVPNSKRILSEREVDELNEA